MFAEFIAEPACLRSSGFIEVALVEQSPNFGSTSGRSGEYECRSKTIEPGFLSRAQTSSLSARA